MTEHERAKPCKESEESEQRKQRKKRKQIKKTGPSEVHSAAPQADAASEALPEMALTREQARTRRSAKVKHVTEDKRRGKRFRVRIGNFDQSYSTEHEAEHAAALFAKEQSKSPTERRVEGDKEDREDKDNANAAKDAKEANEAKIRAFLRKNLSKKKSSTQLKDIKRFDDGRRKPYSVTLTRGDRSDGGDNRTTKTFASLSEAVVRLAKIQGCSFDEEDVENAMQDDTWKNQKQNQNQKQKQKRCVVSSGECVERTDALTSAIGTETHRESKRIRLTNASEEDGDDFLQFCTHALPPITPIHNQYQGIDDVMYQHMRHEALRHDIYDFWGAV